MKLIHLSDLHLGKRLCGFSLLDDQAYILDELLDLVREEAPDAVLIAGDIYDKPVPPAEAVALFDDFLVRLAACGAQVLLISGNHDSAERLAFGGRLMDARGVHVSPAYQGTLVPVTLDDPAGRVDIYLIPFLKPANVRRFFPDEAIESYTDAVRCALAHRQPGTGNRSVLVAHQFVTGAATCESEELSVGGLDQVDAQAFAGFDYVALGHLHGPQQVGTPAMRYSGTPLKYSFSEAAHQKSVPIVTLDAPGQAETRLAPLTPRRDLLERAGSYDTLTSRAFYSTFDQNAYLHLTLTDAQEIPDAIGKLRTIYPNIMRLDYQHTAGAGCAALALGPQAERRTPIDLFDDFYQLQNDRPLSPEQRALLCGMIETIWEGQE